MSFSSSSAPGGGLARGGLDGGSSDEEEGDGYGGGGPLGGARGKHGAPPHDNATRVNETQSIGSSTFTIPRQASIASDSQAHKVVISTLALTPLILHFVSASLIPSAYLQTMTRNTSAYPLLPSEMVRVFLDGNFVTNTSMSRANPGETFTNFLGVDAGLKVTFLPVSTRHDTRGWLSKADTTTHRHSTLVHNTKGVACHVIVADRLPLSTDERIKIDLVAPSADSVLDEAEVSGGAPVVSEQDMISVVGRNYFSEEDTNSAKLREFISLSKHTNNMIWSRAVVAGEKMEIKFAYKVSWPQGLQVELA